MAYDAELADRVRDVVDTADTGGSEVTEKKMFGGLAFLVGGHMAVAASSQGGLLLRCPPERTEELIAGDPGHAGRFVMRGKEMDGWLRVGADAVADGASLRRWVEVGIAHARSLPPK